MVIAHRLPNSSIAVLLTPREAVMVIDQLLPPESFPWTSSEAQMVAADLKHQIGKILAADGVRDLQESIDHVLHKQGSDNDEEDSPSY